MQCRANVSVDEGGSPRRAGVDRLMPQGAQRYRYPGGAVVIEVELRHDCYTEFRAMRASTRSLCTL
jgi:hypothetical protein